MGLVEVEISEGGTIFRVYAPDSSAVVVKIYSGAFTPTPKSVHGLTQTSDGYWEGVIEGDLTDVYYTFSAKDENTGEWSRETPGSLATAVSLNGWRGYICDMKKTDPEGWETDTAPVFQFPADAVIYELHHRDFSAHESNGNHYKGKFLALAENDTQSPQELTTGIDHLVDLGVTHVQLMPSFDFISLDEATPCLGYNWGYDPGNWNVPEGTYSTSPSDPKSRIREFKQMVMALHSHGIGVIMDVVFNHVGDLSRSPMGILGKQRWFRKDKDGKLSNGSGCGNEIESRDPQMRDIILSSLLHWVKEYHIDGFRFDLMGLMDIETITDIARELRRERPGILLYGEGWKAGDSPLPDKEAAVKNNLSKLGGVGVFSDDIRDALRGEYFASHPVGFAAGACGFEESLKAALTGMVPHPQISYSLCKKSREPYADHPGTLINYVSCHDGLNLKDYIDTLRGSVSAEEAGDIARLMLTAIFVSQGIPFIFGGDEFLRSRRGESNPYNSPDFVNAIDWSDKERNRDFYEYCKALIRFRKEDPVLRLRTADEVSSSIRFAEDDPRECPNLVRMHIKAPEGSRYRAKEIYVIFNGSNHHRGLRLPTGEWELHSDGHEFYEAPQKIKRSYIEVAPYRAALLVKVFSV